MSKYSNHYNFHDQSSILSVSVIVHANLQSFPNLWSENKVDKGLLRLLVAQVTVNSFSGRWHQNYLCSRAGNCKTAREKESSQPCPVFSRDIRRKKLWVWQSFHLPNLTCYIKFSQAPGFSVWGRKDGIHIWSEGYPEKCATRELYIVTYRELTNREDIVLSLIKSWKSYDN